MAFWVAFGLPVSFLGMFIFAPIFGLTINVLSTFGMIIVIGILVDDAIVIAVSKLNPLHYKARPGLPFSLFSIGQTTKVTVTGAKWELINHDMNPTTMGLHNEILEYELSIKVENGSLLAFIDR